MESSTLDIFSLSVLFILGVAVPLLGIWDFRRLIRWVHEGRADARLKTYHWLLVMEWGLTLGLLAWWLLAGRGIDALGLVSGYSGWGWLALGLGLGATAFMIWQMSRVLKSPEDLLKLRDSMGNLKALAPQTPTEHRAFALVSVTAGVCEEILYRGILLAVLTPVVGLWPAVAISSVIFGMGHLYQGFTGLVKTTLVGLAMALLTVFSGSLLVAIVLHVVIDLTSGRMMGAALTGPTSSSRPQTV